MCRRWLMVFLCCVASVASAAQATRSVMAMSGTESGEPAGFDAAQSAALFVGIRQFTNDPDLTEVRYAADDAVDLAFAFAMGRSVPTVPPDRVALALSGEPQKPESRERLEKLRAAGASVHPAAQTDILTLLERQARLAGKQGILVVSFATHGFSAEGEHYLVASSSLLPHKETSLSLSKILDITTASDAMRSLIFLDACRRRMTSGLRDADADARSAAPLIDALGRAHGHVVFSAATRGSYAFDDEERRNGVFTAALLDGLQCSAAGDARGLITVQSLADYVNERVLTWVRKHRDSKAAGGIQLTTDNDSRSMPVALCDANMHGAPAELAPGSARGRALVDRAGTPVDSEPALVQAVESSFQVFNAAGVRLWGGTVRGKVEHAELADLDRDGHGEVVVGVGGEGEDVGKILVFNSDGVPRWSRDTTTTFNYDSARSGRLAVRTFTTGDLFRKGKRQIVTLSLDSQGWFPSRLCVFDHDGTLLSSYWHPGHLHHVVIGAPTERDEPRIIVSGVNNDLRGPLRLDGYVSTVFVLDPKRVAGEAPPYAGASQRGTELWYGVILPPNQVIERLQILDSNQDGVNEISVWSASKNVFYLTFGGQLLSIARGDGAVTLGKFYLLRTK